MECSLYVHLNPVRVKALGQGKDDRAREKLGLLPAEPSDEQVLKRLEKLRAHSWSSYPAYAGYVEPPSWLTCAELWRRCADKRKDPKKEYRDWRRLLPFPEVMAAVATVRGEPWESFVNRYGDWGRDLALYIGRVRCGLTLKELGGYNENIDNLAVPYAFPQENGMRTDCRWLVLTDNAGSGLMIRGAPTFTWSARRYTVEDLESAGHPHELPRRETLELCIDWKQAGTGNTSLRAERLPPYLVDPHPLEWSFFLQAIPPGNEFVKK